MAAKIGQILVASGAITEDQLRQALAQQKRSGGRIGVHLIRLGFITEEKLASFLSKQYGVPAINLDEYKIDPSVLKLIPADLAKKYIILPVSRVGATLTVATADPSNVFAIDDVKFMTGYNVEVVIATESALASAIANYYGGRSDSIISQKQQTQTTATMKFEAKDYTLSDSDLSDNESMSALDSPTLDVDEFDRVVGDALDTIEHVDEEALFDGQADVDEPIIKLVSGILINAIKIGASDIHIEPYETSLRVRYRVDGILALAMNLPLKVKNSITSRLKIMSHLDISERRLPQDGRIKLRLGKKREVDFRVSILPCIHGEKTVMRILDKASLQVDLTKLGFEENALKKFMESLSKPYGMILVTGPTGSGKTTTLYSALNYVNKPNINIMTAEDPVEYNFMGINQVQTKEEIGLTFAGTLRSFLRQSPDIILVGEIRDFETAEIAVKASLTGHLVLSTLHTNDAPGTISRLLNMGVEPFLVSSSVILIMAQRLGRKVCQQCKEEEKFPAHTLLKLGFTEEESKTVKCYKGKGCPICNNSGYKGRIALYEVMLLDDEIRKLILEGASGDELRRAAVRGGMKTLRMSGLTKVKEGVTSVEEVLRVTVGDEA
jgi:type IV pilus assembly protein PilB